MNALQCAQQGQHETTDAFKARLVNLFTTSKITLQAAAAEHAAKLVTQHKKEQAVRMEEELEKLQVLERARCKAEMNKELQLHKERLDADMVLHKQRVQAKATADIVAGLQGAHAAARDSYGKHVEALQQQLKEAHGEVRALQDHINSVQTVHREKLITHNLGWLRQEEQFRRQQTGVMRDLLRDMDRTSTEISNKRMHAENELAQHLQLNKKIKKERV